jgi:hypothetical protein
MAKIGVMTVSLAMAVLCADRAHAQFKPESIRRGKAATALVEVTHGESGASGSAFCVDRCLDGSGLFVTNAHVVENDAGMVGKVRLVVEIGLETQRILPAEVLRRDDEMDLALLRVDRGAGLTALELGRDDGLSDLASVVTFGYPFGTQTAVGGAEFPDVTVLPSRITALRRENDRLMAIQFDNQINPGNSGGPVLDRSGKIVGVARATVVGAGLNLAIPVSRLAEFLKAPALVFDPPEFGYLDRGKPVSWTVRMQPSQDELTVPEPLSVAITLSNGAGDPRTFTADRTGPDTFQATVIPVTQEPDWKVGFRVMWRGGFDTGVTQVSDPDVRGGKTTLILGLLRNLQAEPSPRTASLEVSPERPTLTLRTVPSTSARQSTTIDLNQAEHIQAGDPEAPTVQTVVAQAEARQGANVVATVRRRTRLETPRGVKGEWKEPLLVEITPPRPAWSTSQYPILDDGKLTLGRPIVADGRPRGSDRSIRPPDIEIPSARLTALATDAPLERRLRGKISNVTVGGGGRFIILTLEENRQVAIFDVNKADLVKTIDMPAAGALVAAGASKLLIVFPNEKLLQRWDLETLRRDGPSRASPIDGHVISLAMGSDSAGPALAWWSDEAAAGSQPEAQFSFIDLDSLTVPTVAMLASQGIWTKLSKSGGSFRFDVSSASTMHLRASAGGGLFECGVRALSVHGGVVVSSLDVHGARGDHPVPGPDGRTVFTPGVGGPLDLNGNEIYPNNRGRFDPLEYRMPSHDPAYYLSVVGLDGASSAPVSCKIHAADGSLLRTVHGLEEMAPKITTEPVRDGNANDFTIEKRFHFVPAAQLLITIPAENDRLVLRRLEIVKT